MGGSTVTHTRVQHDQFNIDIGHTVSCSTETKSLGVCGIFAGYFMARA